MDEATKEQVLNIKFTTSPNKMLKSLTGLPQACLSGLRHSSKVPINAPGLSKDLLIEHN